MWADTYYIDLFKVSVNTSLMVTTNPQVNQTWVDSVPSLTSSSQVAQPTISQGEPETPEEGARGKFMYKEEV